VYNVYATGGKTLEKTWWTIHGLLKTLGKIWWAIHGLLKTLGKTWWAIHGLLKTLEKTCWAYTVSLRFDWGWFKLPYLVQSVNSQVISLVTEIGAPWFSCYCIFRRPLKSLWCFTQFWFNTNQEHKLAHPDFLN
jgi:hypothetical protein